VKHQPVEIGGAAAWRGGSESSAFRGKEARASSPRTSGLEQRRSRASAISLPSTPLRSASAHHGRTRRARHHPR
jgi:hypothetical protein